MPAACPPPALDTPPARRPPARPLRRALSWALTLAGLGLFAYLVLTSGITWPLLAAFGWTGFGLLLAVSAVVIALDTVGWFYAIRHLTRPGALRLLWLRVAGDSLTNALPGGVVLGETYKAAMLRSWFGISLADGAAGLMMVKFGLGFSQAAFVLLGLGLCYPDLESRSMELFGIQGAQHVGLALTIGTGLLMAFPLALMFMGHPFTSAARMLARLPIPPLRRRLASSRERIERLDRSCTQVLHNNRLHLALVFSFLLAGWILGTLESYVLLHFLGLPATLRTAFVVESVGSMFRLVFFLVPSGIGGQDASFMALFKLYDLPTPAAGGFVLLKRLKELLWIGVGFLLVVLSRQLPARRVCPDSCPDSSPVAKITSQPFGELRP